MQRFQLTARSIVSAATIGFGVCLAGCAASEKSSFTNHLAATVNAGPASNDDVAVAFSLESAVPASAVARGNRAQPGD